MQKTSNKIISVLLVLAVCLGLTACHKNNELEVATKTTMNVSEAIAAEKTTPYFDKSLETLVSYQNEEAKQAKLNNEDIREITSKVEQYSALLCNDVPDGYDLDAVDFLVNDTAKDIVHRAEENSHTTKLQTCQILNLDITNKNTVEATCIITTKKDNEEVYFDMAYIKFEKTNSKWYILGGQELIYAPLSQYTISRDAISGKIVVAPIEQNDTSN